jgi:preprotein translocase subunit SecE
MTEQIENKTGSSGLDWLWLTATVVLVIGGLVAFYSLNADMVAVRVSAVVAGTVLGIVAFAMSSWGRLAWQFGLSSRVELRKMVWPSYEDTRKTTLIVFVFVVVMGFFFWGVDALFGWITRHLLGTGT